MQVVLIHGPNLNLLGTREPAVYGEMTLGDLEDHCRSWAAELGMTLSVFQSNHEGELIDRIHSCLGTTDGILINPGALTHYSYALHDAIAAVGLPTVEVHLSDITDRESWRAQSVIAAACATSVAGKGPDGYREALEVLASKL